MAVHDCFSVYHEGFAEGVADVIRKSCDSGQLYEVRRGRYGGWLGYRNEERVLWDGFRYGSSHGGVPVDTFWRMLVGDDVALPGTYRKKHASWSRIDVVGARPLSSIYLRDVAADHEWATRLSDSCDYVVHYVEDTRNGFMGGGVLGIVVSGADYPTADFEFYTRLALGGHGLPSEVCCVGDPTSIEDFLTIEWHKLRGEMDSIAARRWRVEMAAPKPWAEAFCLEHDAFDIYGTDWVDAADVVMSASELICPYDSERGVIAGIRMTREGIPVLSTITEFEKPLGFEEVYKFFAGPVGGVAPVVADGAIISFVRVVSRSGIAPVFAGTLSKYSEAFYAAAV